LPKDSSIHSQKAFADKIRKELPAFIHYLENEHKIRPELADGRFGIKAYHHPRFIEDIIDSSPEGALWDMMERAGLTQAYDGSELGGEYDGGGSEIPGSGRRMELSSADIYDKIRENPKTKEEASKYLKNPSHVGKLLGRLNRRPNSRLKIRPGRGRSTFYSFAPPSQRAEEPF
jgi:hypothetical protein